LPDRRRLFLCAPKDSDGGRPTYAVVDHSVGPSRFGESIAGTNLSHAQPDACSDKRRHIGADGAGQIPYAQPFGQTEHDEDDRASASATSAGGRRRQEARPGRADPNPGL
jgi:hypothetical protein